MAVTVPQAQCSEVMTSVERWFKLNGVPQFVRQYSIEDRLTLLLFLLLTVAAFQVGAAPDLDPSPGGLLLGLAFIMGVTLCAKPWLAPVLEPGCPPPRLPSRAVRGGVLAFALGFALWYRPPVDYPYLWIDFPVLVVCAFCTAALSSRGAWDRVLGHRPRAATAFVASLLVLVVLFTLEGSVLSDANDIFGFAAAVPPAASGLPVMLLVCLAVLWFSVVERNGAALGSQRLLKLHYPATPLLTLILGVEIAVLPHTARAPSTEALLPLAFLGVAAAVILVANRGTPASGRKQLFWVFAALFVAGYPAIVGLFLEIDVLGTSMVGLEAFLITAAINLVCLALAFVVVREGIDRIAGWAVREAWEARWSIVRGVARGLPLLLILTVFLVMQAELWQVAALTSDVAYLILLWGMFALGLAATIVTASQALDRQLTFECWQEVRVAAVRGGHTRVTQAPTHAFRRVLKELVRSGPELTSEDQRLSPRARFNAIAIIAVYQTLIFVPIVLVGVALFWCLARLAVPAEVASEWIYGDDAGGKDADRLRAAAFFDSPWARVAGLLAAFSYLSLTVQIPANADQRRDFLSGADAGIRQRLAIRLAYQQMTRSG